MLVLSENANKLAFVKREVERAVSKGKPVFPIRLREVLPSKALELFISSAHWIDAWSHRSRNAWSGLPRQFLPLLEPIRPQRKQPR